MNKKKSTRKTSASCLLLTEENGQKKLTNSLRTRATSEDNMYVIQLSRVV